jgi:DNA polymerase-3 subunit beta
MEKMKFSVLREDLSNAVQTVQYSANAKGMMPILSGIKIEAVEGRLTFHTTDLEAYTMTSCSGNVEKEGECVVNQKVLMDILRDSRDEKTDIEVIGNEMVMQGQKSVIRLFTMPVEDFPNVPVVEIPVLEELQREIFMPAVQKVSRAASKDEKRPSLVGILLEVGEDGLNMVSTDSYRLAISRIREGFKVSEAGQYIIPSSAMVNLARIAGKSGKIDMYRDENRGQIRFDLGDSNHIIRLIEGKFPKYEQFIPESLEKKAEVEKEEMLGALKRASLISSTVKMNISSEGLSMTSESKEVGEGKENVTVEYMGEEIEIAFNSRFFEDGIQCIEGERVVMGMSEPLKPGIIKEKESEGFLYIIMPIRL